MVSKFYHLGIWISFGSPDLAVVQNCESHGKVSDNTCRRLIQIEEEERRERP
jgi:hypothetical protein